MNTICPGCAAPNPGRARFCNQCGARLAQAIEGQPDLNAELRQVTVLFCDLVRSTELANLLDYEDLMQVFQAFRDVVRRSALAHSGHRIRFAGDGARVIFGHPETREDATESAVRCGLELAVAMRAADCPGKPLDLRVGIAFGTAVVNDAVEETSSSGEAIIGSVAHLAARLMSSAPPGDVVIDHATRRLIGGFFDCRDLGVRRMKGFEHGVHVWSVAGETQLASRHAARRDWRIDDRMIGRDAEVRLLHSLWRRASSGLGGCVTFVGEAGIGKSRLAHALDAVVEADEAICLGVDCTPRTTTAPFFPISVLARHLAGIQDADSSALALRRGRRLLTRLVGRTAKASMPYLGPLFSASEGAASGLGESAEMVRERTIGLILDLLRRLAEQTPLLIRFEDLQWSDATSATLLQRLIEASVDRRTLVIVTARPETDLSGLKADHTEVLHLDPFDEASSRALIRQIVAGEDLPPATLDAIIRRGEGVPFYIEELTRNALEAPDPDEPSGTDTADAGDIPATLRNIIQGRLDRSPAQLNATKAAAVMGRELSLRLLCEVLDRSLSEVQQAVARLVDDGILIPPHHERPDSIQFKHSLTQEAVYNYLLRTERHRLHSRAADILMRQPAGTPYASSSVLAYHLRSAERFEDAVRCLLAASADNIAKAAYLESAGNCRSGLEVIDLLQEAATRMALRRQLLIQLGVALSATSGYAAPEVEEAYREARTCCDDQSDPAALYSTIRGLATFHLVRGDLSVYYDLSLQCLKLADQAKLPALSIDALGVYGYATYYFGNLADSRDALERCLALYQAEHGEQLEYPTPQDAATVAWSLLPTVAWLMGDARATETAVGAGIEHVERLGRPFDAAVLHSWLAGTRYTQRRYVEAAVHARTAAETSEKYGYSTWAATSRIMLRLSDAMLEPKPETLGEVQQLCAGFEAAGVGLNASYYLLGLARGLVRLGDANGARGVIGEALRRAAQCGESRNNAELLILQAGIEPDPATAEHLLASALTLAEEQGAVTTALRAALAMLKRRGDCAGPVKPDEASSALDGADPLPEGWIADRLREAKACLGTPPAAAPSEAGTETETRR